MKAEGTVLAAYSSGGQLEPCELIHMWTAAGHISVSEKLLAIVMSAVTGEYLVVLHSFPCTGHSTIYTSNRHCMLIAPSLVEDP